MPPCSRFLIESRETTGTPSISLSLAHSVHLSLKCTDRRLYSPRYNGLKMDCGMFLFIGPGGDRMDGQGIFYPITRC
jgi:hypothetical protein